ncbi:hypothetical protein ACFQ2T_10935 [Methylophilus flavus]|jgi:hypothetical protein|uniref:Uncharacterized protein n=1 Tax=Methylophilus flavus TaxID=640084 RepID=A0ABW3PHI2_9PROT
MAKSYLSKQRLSSITSMAISAGALVASVLMMFLIFITTIVMIGIVLS